MPKNAEPSVGAGRRFAHTTDKGFTAAFEFVMTPALFAFFGHLLDLRVGTGKLFALLFAAAVLAYEVWKVWYNYNTEIDQLHADMLRPRSSSPSAPAVAADEP
jgi:hypothetical protein